MDHRPGEPNDDTYIKQAQYHIKGRRYEIALYYCGLALQFNQASKVRISKILLLLGIKLGEL